MKKSEPKLTAKFRRIDWATEQLELSPAQAQVASLQLGSVALAVGWPGSGKTEALKALMLSLSRAHKPERVLVLAANRTASANLRDQLALAYQGATLGPMARTLSSLAFAVIRHSAIEHKSKLPELITGAEQDAMLETILARVVAGELHITKLPKQISKSSLGLNGFRSELRDLLAVVIEESITPSELSALGAKKDKPEWQLAAELYQFYLDELNASYNTHRFDPSALLVEATRILQTEAWPEQLVGIKQILVDDAQELTPAAANLLRTLSSKGAGVVLFGDPDVTTLGFRAADPEMMHDLASSIAKAQGKSVEEIYIYPEHATHPAGIAGAISRISPRIPVAKAGPQRKGLTPPSELTADESIEAKVFTLQQEEAGWIAGRLRQLHLEEKVAWREMAVVARSVDELEELENALAAESVPVRLVGARTALRDEFGSSSYLKLLRYALTKQAIDYETAIDLFTSPIAGFDALTLRRLRRALRSQEFDAGGTRNSQELLVDLFSAPGSAASIQIPEGKMAQRLIALFFELRQLSTEPNTTVEDLLWHAWVNSHPSKSWQQLAKGTDEVALQANRNLDSVVALFAAAARYVERNPNGSAIEFVEQQLALKLPEDTLGFSGNAQHSVSLLTPAGLLGRRFRVISIAHLQEGIWPNLRPRSSLLGTVQLTALLKDPNADISVAPRSELPAELRMLYKAIGAATEKILVSAIDTEEEQVSQFVRAIAGHDPEAEEYLEDRLTLRGMVGTLRRGLIKAKTDGERTGLAIQLARLAAENVPGADPRQWYGILPPSTTEPLAVLGATDETGLVVHPSELENYLRCPLHWFINAHGGGDQSFKTRVGTLMHEVLETATVNSANEFQRIIDSKWHTLEFESSWAEQAEKRRVKRMIFKLLEYLNSFDAAGGAVIGKEVGFTFEVAGATVRGTVDRIEIYPNGEVFIADLKTSKYKVSKEKLATHPQLGVYQLAAMAERFEDIPQLQSSPVIGGAKLIEIGAESASVEGLQNSMQGDAQLRAVFEGTLEQITAGMSMPELSLVAKVSEHCTDKYGYGTCSLHLIEQVSYGR